MKHRKKVAVIGYPVKHSLSPALHGYWLEKYGIDGEYGMLEVPPEELEATLLSLKDLGYAGCNLTIPHKEAALKIVKDIRSAECSKFAEYIGAINTIVVTQDGRLFADNTDAEGFVKNIENNAPTFNFSAGKTVILGAGGAARAVIFGTIQKQFKEIETYANRPNNIEIVIVNRTKESAEKIRRDLTESFGNDENAISYSRYYTISVVDWEDKEDALEGANLLVNTTSLGMAGQPALEIDLGQLPGEALVTDIVYKPLETTLLKNARMRGNLIVDGLGMLLYQAQGGFEMWYGKRPEVTQELRENVLKAMKEKDANQLGK